MTKDTSKKTAKTPPSQQQFSHFEAKKYQVKYHHMFDHAPAESDLEIDIARKVMHTKSLTDAKNLRSILNSQSQSKRFEIIVDWYIMKLLELPEEHENDPLDILLFINLKKLNEVSLTLKKLIAKEKARKFTRFHGIWLIQFWRFYKIRKAFHALVNKLLKRP